MGKPLEKFKEGSLETSIWVNQVGGNELKSVKLKRSFTDKDNNWKDQSITLFQKDLSKAIFLLGEAYRFILNSQNKTD